MSLQDIMTQVEKLPECDRRELRVFLAQLRDREDPELRQELAARIDDRDAGEWLSLGQLLAAWER